MTFEEHLAEQLKNPGYAAAHAIGRPFSNLALNVWSLRVGKGITQQQLARAANVKEARIAKIERDETNPRLHAISRIAFALDVTASRLLEEPEEWRLANARAVAERGAPPYDAENPARHRKNT